MRSWAGEGSWAGGNLSLAEHSRDALDERRQVLEHAHAVHQAKAALGLGDERICHLPEAYKNESIFSLSLSITQ